ncbi:MAG: hypothetical protein P4M10_02790 [Verrucomicrobiae bacterium]|nr:hypothetical protein [Verrucomicrobiae bacterium]
MNAESELFRAYREWRRLALAEAKAIQARNWSLFSDCHRAIRDFQSLVPGLTRAARAEWQRSDCLIGEKERNLQVLVAGLMELTRQNHTQLREMLAQARAQRAQLAMARRNLQQLRRTYAQVPGGRCA